MHVFKYTVSEATDPVESGVLAPISTFLVDVK